MKPTTIPELQEIIRAHSRIAPNGAGSKTALACVETGAVSVALTGLRGLLEYQPDEYTFTCLAGTPVAEVEQILADNGQYLPFDPVLVASGATLGGTVAAGLSGPGRYRYGGVRDFLLGVQFADGQGNLVRAGGRVVKNAAGFDLPKFMVGSLGSYGALVELAFKVFPHPESYATLLARYPSLAAGLAALIRLTRQPVEIYSLELEPADGGADLFVRVGGAEPSLLRRIERTQQILGGEPATVMRGEEEIQFWQSAREFHWLPPGDSLVKVPLTPRRVSALEEAMRGSAVRRVYSSGANLAWLGWRGELAPLDEILVRLELSGLVVLGKPGVRRLGARVGETFARRMKQALDPQDKFVGD
jgi:glycolate oxidase FAD binding subunit